MRLEESLSRVMPSLISFTNHQFKPYTIYPCNQSFLSNCHCSFELSHCIVPVEINFGILSNILLVCVEYTCAQRRVARARQFTHLAHVLFPCTTFTTQVSLDAIEWGREKVLPRCSLEVCQERACPISKQRQHNFLIH